MPNWGTTDFINPYAWTSMGPYAWTSNYGYEMQMNVLPDSISYDMAQLFHGALNSNHVSQWNPLFSVPVENRTTNPYLTQQGMEAAAGYAHSLMRKALDGATFGQTAQTLSAIQGQTQVLLKDENLTTEQKEKLESLVEKTKEIQEQLKKYKKDAQKPDSDKDALSAKLQEISKAVGDLKNEAVEVVKKIKEELQAAKSDETEKPDETEGTETVAEIEKPDETEGTETVAETEKPDETEGTETVAETEKPDETEETETTPETGKPEKTTGTQSYSVKHSQSQYTTSQAAIEAGKTISKDVYDAVDGWFGTDNDKLKGAMDSITKDNVMETLDAWATTHQKEFSGETMLESIYSDVSSGDTRKEYTLKIANALQEKATEANIDVSEYIEKLNKELDSWWRDDAAIYKIITTIYESLGGKKYLD